MVSEGKRHKEETLGKKYGFEFRQNGQAVRQGQLYFTCDNLHSKVLALHRKGDNRGVNLSQSEIPGF